MLLFLARLSFAAEESPTCDDGGDEITLTIEGSGIDLEASDTYDWTFGEEFFERGGQVLDTTGPTTTIRCPGCVDGESHRWGFQVEVSDDEGNLIWAYGYFEQECPDRAADVSSCASNRGGGSVWLTLLALAFRRRRS